MREDDGSTGDEPVVMTASERIVWVYLVTVVLTSGTYLTLTGVRLSQQPAEEIDWVVPMLWTLAASVVGTIVLSVLATITGPILATIARSITSARHGGAVDSSPPCTEIETEPDARDRDIDQRGSQALLGVLGVGFVGALALAMLDVDTFWIGHLLFVAGTVGALVETTTKIRLYRRGF